MAGWKKRGKEGNDTGRKEEKERDGEVRRSRFTQDVYYSESADNSLPDDFMIQILSEVPWVEVKVSGSLVMSSYIQRAIFP